MASIRFAILLTIAGIAHLTDGGPPRVEDRPLLLDSFIPAAMQVIAHLTDLMKYDLRPQKPSTTFLTTTTTLRPTPAHKPGLYAPERPSHAQNYYDSRRNSLPADGRSDYFRRHALRDAYGEIEANLNVQDAKDLELIGVGYRDLLRHANRLDDVDDDDASDEDAVRNLLNGLDDSAYALELLRQKRVPPTRAYVTLLQLYDQLNKESKRLNLNKYGGYADVVLKLLIDSSRGTSAEQLNLVLGKIAERRDTSNEAILKKIDPLLVDLSKSDSYIHDALRYIPPLQFVN